MKHLKIMTCLLLLGSMAPTTALCTGKDASKRGKEKGCDRPYSEAVSYTHLTLPTTPSV